MPAYIGGGNNMDLMPQVVEGQQAIKEEEAAVRHMQIVFCRTGNALKLAHKIVSYKTDSAGSEGRQIGHVRGTVLAQKFAEHGDRTSARNPFLSRLANFYCSIPGDERHVRTHSQE